MFKQYSLFVIFNFCKNIEYEEVVPPPYKIKHLRARSVTNLGFADANLSAVFDISLKFHSQFSRVFHSSIKITANLDTNSQKANKILIFFIKNTANTDRNEARGVFAKHQLFISIIGQKQMDQK